jgi:hypothetical protein
MYIWKCWRDNRAGFFVFLIVFTGLTVLWGTGMHRANRSVHIVGVPEDNWAFLLALTFGLALLSGFVMALGFGSNNAGTDIGNGSGDFLFTRPRSRTYYVWAGWTVAIVQLAFVTIFAALLSSICMYYQFAKGSRPMPGGPHSAGVAIWDIALILATVMVTAGMIYGLTYFIGILTRSGRKAVIYSMCVIFVYGVAQGLMSWLANISLPNLTIKPYFFAGLSYAPQSSSLEWELQLAARAVVALLFPAAAQFLLKRTDI